MKVLTFLVVSATIKSSIFRKVLAFSKTSLLLSLKKTRAPKFLQGTMKWKDYVTQTFIYALARLLTWKLGLTQRNLHSFEFKFAHPNENVIFFWSPNWVHWKIGPIPSLNSQSCNRRPLCSTFRFEIWVLALKKPFFQLFQLFSKKHQKL